MGLAEQMLASMSVDDVTEKHSQKEEEHVVVNESRQIVVPNSLKTIAVTKDEDVQTITFDCVRFWDGNDLSTFAIYLNYVLPDGTPATYIPESVVTSDGDAFYHFEWKIKNNITQKSGKISIGITAIKTKVDEGGETVVDKRWSSLPNTDCSIALGIDVSDVPTEEESAGVVAQLTAILEKIQGDLDEWLTDNVVQTTGTSKSKVMSQEAVTIELEKEKNRSNSYVDKKYMELDNLIVRTSKRVENIETGLQEGSFVTDDSVEYQKNVPQNALRYAELKSVGGMTYRDTATNTLKDSPVTAVKSVGANQIPFPYLENTKTANGLTFTVNADGSIRIAGTATANTSFYLVGESSAQRKPIKAGTYTARLTGSADIAFIIGIAGDNEYPAYDYGRSISVAKDTTYYARLRVLAGVTVKATVYPMFNKGSTALPYSPYTESTLPIPAAVQALNGYGQGINATYNNHIAWSEDGTEKTYNKRVKTIVFDGVTDGAKADATDTQTEKASYYAYVSRTNASVVQNSPTIVNDTNVSVGTEGVLSLSISATLLGLGTTPTKSEILAAVNKYLNDKYLAGNPVTVVYALATPIVTDISNLITSDNFIEVDGGGTLTFENEYGYAVPSEVEYQVEV